MLTIHTLPVGMLQTNCYILHKTDRCILIDPGDEADKILAATDRLGLTVEAVLLTHGHFDHKGGVADVASRTGCPVYLCTEELSLPSMMTRGPLQYTHTYGDGDTLTLAGCTFTVKHTPGHSPGSVCLCFEDVIFSGDTLFAGSCGRTDFPGSNPADMRRSLDWFRTLEKNYTIYPGHGESTTLEEEKRYNPFL